MRTFFISRASRLISNIMYCCCRSIRDSDGPIVADAFYGHLLSLTASANAAASAIPDGTHAAHALHLAVAKLRAETKCSFRRWVPFIHLGR